MEKNYTNKTVKNTIWGIISYIIITLITLVNRRFFSDILNNEYLGLHSVLLTFINLIMLVELGVGTAIIFSLYKPILEKNYKYVKAILSYFQKIYLVISLLMIVIGIISTFFLDSLVNSTISNKEVTMYFLLFIFGSAISYYFSYKKSLLYATQQNYIISITHFILKILANILQLLYLYLLKDYFGYLLIYLASNILESIICGAIANRKIQSLKEIESVELDKDTKNSIFKKITGVGIFNISNFLVTGSENIVISYFWGMGIVGIYNSYLLIIQTLKTLFGQFFSAFTTSFGGLYESNDKERVYNVFNITLFLSFIIATCSVPPFIFGIIPFVKIWMGADYVIDIIVVVLMGINFFFVIVNTVLYSVQNATGMHYLENKINIVYTVVYLILLVLGTRYLNLTGALLASIISFVIFPNIAKPKIVYKDIFQKPVKTYYYKQLIFLGILFLSLLFVFGIKNFTNLLIDNYYLNSLVIIIFAFIIPVLIILLVFYKSAEIKYLKDFIKRLVFKH